MIYCLEISVIFQYFGAIKSIIFWQEVISLYKIRQRQKAFIEDYNTIIDVCPEFKQWSLKDFLWARTIVGSRNFGIDIGGVNRTAMVPLSDMLKS